MRAPQIHKLQAVISAVPTTYFSTGPNDGAVESRAAETLGAALAPLGYIPDGKHRWINRTTYDVVTLDIRSIGAMRDGVQGQAFSISCKSSELEKQREQASRKYNKRMNRTLSGGLA